MPRQILIINKSTVVGPADLAPVIAAQQKQIDNDFATAWSGLRADLVYSADDNATAERIYLLDNSDQADTLGYHDFQGGEPVGFVFAKTSIDAGYSWTSTFSHEVLEQLADPDVNSTAIAPLPSHPGRQAAYAYEVCDAVEADLYKIDGVELSNFVLPGWFVPGSPGPWDFLKLCTAPLQLRKEGYIGYTANLHSWQQLDGGQMRAHRVPIGKWCRRTKRVMKCQ